MEAHAQDSNLIAFGCTTPGEGGAPAAHTLVVVNFQLTGRTARPLSAGAPLTPGEARPLIAFGDSGDWPAT